MKLSRRRCLDLVAGVAALPALSRMARAQNYPSRPVRIIVTVAAGGGADITARLIAQWLSERLGQQFIVENRSGGSGNIGTEAVVRAPADGYTLLLIAVANAVNVTLFETSSLQFHQRHRSRVGRHPRGQCRVRSSIGSGQDDPRADRLCQGQSRQAQHGFRRQRNVVARGRRVVQDDDRRRHGARALSWPKGSRSPTFSAGRCR